ncbi:hypothetical protein [Aeromonas hydrophila]|uniref:hypothetical protein n=1 Tax=Aeromonas hydrophila TaxID=644 RepID=UPI003D1979CF
MNKQWFKNDNPPAGTQVIVAAVGKTGTRAAGESCYSKPDYECVGAVVANTTDTFASPLSGSAEPTGLFPAGTLCARVPTFPGSCAFDIPSAVVDLGVVGADGAGQTINLGATCTGGEIGGYQISLPGGGSSVSSDKVSVKLTANGKPLPNEVKLSGGKNQVAIEASATPVAGETGEFSLTAVLLLQAL